MAAREILKVGLAVVEGRRLMLVRKRGLGPLILSGGKPEAGEDDAAALAREIREELGCGVVASNLSRVGDFTAPAAGQPGASFTVRLYRGLPDGVPEPRAEIEGILWFDADASDPSTVAASIRGGILQALIGNGSHPDQG